MKQSVLTITGASRIALILSLAVSTLTCSTGPRTGAPLDAGVAVAAGDAATDSPPATCPDAGEHVSGCANCLSAASSCDDACFATGQTCRANCHAAGCTGACIGA